MASPSFLSGFTLLFLLLALLAQVHAQFPDSSDDKNVFINPGAAGPNENFVGNQKFTLGNEEVLSWATTMTSYSVMLYQQMPEIGGLERGEVFATSRGSGVRNQKWTVEAFDSDLKESPVFFFWINPGTDGSITSHYFNITDGKETPSSTPALSTSTSSNSPSPSPTDSPITTPTPTSEIPLIVTAGSNPTPSPVQAPATSPPADEPGMSTVVKMGLGVGLGVGVPLVLIAGVWVGLKAAKRRREGLAQAPASTNAWPHNSYPPEYKATPYVYAQHQTVVTHELPYQQGSPHELDGGFHHR